MTHDADPGRIDDRLSRLLGVEERLEARVQEAERASRQAVAAAREQLAEAREKERAGFEATAQAEERADREAHHLELEAIARANAAELEALRSVSEDVVERLARRAVAEAIDSPPERS